MQLLALLVRSEGVCNAENVASLLLVGLHGRLAKHSLLITLQHQNIVATIGPRLKASTFHLHLRRTSGEVLRERLR